MRINVFFLIRMNALVLLYRKKKIFPKVMVGIYIASIILTFIGFIVSYLLAIPDVGSGFFSFGYWACRLGFLFSYIETGKKYVCKLIEFTKV